MKSLARSLLKCLLITAFFGTAPITRAQPVLTNAFITQLISREYSVDIGGVQTPDIKQVTSHEFSLFINNGPANPYSQASSREYSLAVVATIPPPPVTGFTASNSPSGNQVLLNWRSYNQWAAAPIAAFNIYLSYTSFSSLAGMTPYLTVPAESVSALLTNLPAFRDYSIAIVAVDSLGQSLSSVVPKGIYIISPQVVSREFSLAIGNDTPQPQYQQLSSREYSLVVDQAAPPPPVSGLVVTPNASGSSVALNWSAYNQWAFGDIAQYAIYYSAQPFTNVTGLMAYVAVRGETFSFTLNGLQPFQNYYFAVVPVDAAGNFNPNVTYAGDYPLSPQVLSREFSLSIENGPALPESQISSREFSLLITGTNTAAPVTGIGSGFTAVTSRTAYDAIDINWTSYNELLQQDVVGYQIYLANGFFQSVTNLTPLAFLPAGNQTHTVTGLFSSLTYFVAVVAQDGSGNFNPNVYAISAQPSGPDITFNSQPQSQTNVLGGSTAFGVSVSGEGPFGYQWLFNANPLPGQAAPTLVLNNLQFVNAGGYSVAVTNAYGGATSSVARLVVGNPPTNFPPVLPTVPAQSISALTLLTITNTAAEADPRATVTYSLLSAPLGASISTNGIITWTPTAAQSPSTNTITTVATSSDLLAVPNPRLSATNSFTVIVTHLAFTNFDAVRDFSTNANPNGVWSYGWSTGLGAPFKLLTTLAIFNPQDAGWWSGLPEPNSIFIDKNFSTAPVLLSGGNGDIVFDPDTLHMDPEGDAVVTRFTAPYTTLYAVTGFFRIQDTVTHAHYVSVILNGTNTTFQAFTSGDPYATQYPFTFTTNLTQGDTVDFIVSCNNGDFSYLGTGLAATLTITNSPTAAPTNTFGPVPIGGITATNLGGSPGYWLTWLAPTNEQFLVQWTPSIAPSGWHAFTNIVRYSGPATATTNGVFTFFDDGMQTAGFAPSRFYQLLPINPAMATNLTPVFPIIPDQVVPVLHPLNVINAVTQSSPYAAITYALVNAPAGMNISSSGLITWTPGLNQSSGTNIITTVATSTDYVDLSNPVLSATNRFTVIVPEANLPPRLPALSTFTVNELTLLTVTNTAAESSRHSTTIGYALINPPAGMTINTNGIISWTPAQTQSPGTNLITTVVHNSNSIDALNPTLTATNAFTVIVRELNVAPVLPLISAQTVTELSLLTVTNTAAEPNIHATLTYALISPPPGLTISSSGILHWTPTTAQSPSTNTITTVVLANDPFDTLNPVLTATNSFVAIVKPGLLLTAPSWNPNGAFQFTFLTVAGVNYTIETSNDLLNWTPIEEFQGSGGTVTFIDPDADATASAYYRVMAQNP